MGSLSVGGHTQGLEAGVKWMMDDGDHPFFSETHHTIILHTNI